MRLNVSVKLSRLIALNLKRSEGKDGRRVVIFGDVCGCTVLYSVRVQAEKTRVDYPKGVHSSKLGNPFFVLCCATHSLRISLVLISATVILQPKHRSIQR